MRLDDDGVVADVIGRPIDDGSLTEIGALTVDHDGSLHVTDSRTGNHFVFAGDGTLLRADVIAPTDFETRLVHKATITVDGRGDAYYNLGFTEVRRPTEYMHVSATGERLGFESLDLDSISETWLFQPGTRTRWVIGYKTVYLVNDGGDVVRTIERRPDNTWFGDVWGGAVAPDGSLAVAAFANTFSGGAICVYTAEGDPVSMCEVGPDSYWSMAFTGSEIILTGRRGILLVDIHSGLRRLHASAGDATVPLACVSADGRAVWIYDEGTLDLTRYRVAAEDQDQ